MSTNITDLAAALTFATKDTIDHTAIATKAAADSKAARLVSIEAWAAAHKAYHNADILQRKASQAAQAARDAKTAFDTALSTYDDAIVANSKHP